LRDLWERNVGPGGVAGGTARPDFWRWGHLRQKKGSAFIPDRTPWL
jgi:hypothetical protein